MFLEAPPKRDFIKENVRSLKQIELRNLQVKSETDLVKLNGKQRLVRGRNASPMKAFTGKVVPEKNENSTKALKKQPKPHMSRQNGRKQRVYESDESRPNSVQSRDAFSQTETVDDGYFLKDVIIR